MRRFLALPALIALAAPAVAQSPQSVRADDRANYVRAIAAGYKAAFLCSGVFNAGRTVSLVDLLQMFHFARRSLAIIVDGWAPEAMIVSFKLETDPSILVKKADYALKKYSHHLFIGNLLSTRKWEVVFVSQAGEHWIRVPRNKRTPSFSGRIEQIGLASGRQDGEDVAQAQFVPDVRSLVFPQKGPDPLVVGGRGIDVIQDPAVALPQDIDGHRRDNVGRAIHIIPRGVGI